MKLLLIFVGLIASAYGQYGFPLEETTATAPATRNCESLADGNYGDGCTPDYYACVAGISYGQKCPAGLVFDEARNQCVYPGDCGVEATTSRDLPSTTRRTTNQRPSDIECAGLPDGSHSIGCTEYYTMCSFGVATVVDCPEGLLFDRSTGDCEYANLCGRPVETKTTVLPTGYLFPTTTTVNGNDSPFDCQNKEDHYYSLGCSNEFVKCVAGSAFIMKCPAELVFHEGRCDVTCKAEETTTVAQDSTTFPSTTTRVTTDAPLTTPEPVSTTSGSSSCPSGDVSFPGNCSSTFQRCRCSRWLSVSCPGSSTLDAATGLCLYGLPECAIAQDPVQYPTVSAPSESYPSAPVYPAPQPRGYVPWETEQLLSNPFFAPKRRSHKKESRDKISKMKGKLRAESKPIRLDDRTSYVQDAFSGPFEPYVHSSSWSVFPRSRVHRMRMREAMKYRESKETIPDLMQEGSNDLPATTPQSARTAQGLGDEVEGSGSEEMLMPEVDATPRLKRSYATQPGSTNNAHSFCQGVATNTLVSLGHCRQQFILCRSYVAWIAGCPVGDLYDDEKSACVPGDLCGVPGSDVCAAVVPASPVEPTSFVSPTEPSSAVPAVQSLHCTTGFSGVVASACSKDYVVCDQGSEYPMSCPEGLVYDESTTACDFPSNVISCSSSPGAHPVVPYVPMASTPSAFSGDCAGASDGYVSAGPCSSQYLMCHSGELRARMNCPSNLVFNGIICTYPADVAECSESVQTTDVPAALHQATASAQPSVVTVGYPTAAAPDTATTTKALCATPFSPVGVCSPKYKVCMNGIYHEMTCASSLVFNKVSGACDYKHLVEDCSTEPVTTLPATVAIAAPTTSPTGLVFNEEKPQEQQHNDGCSEADHGAFIADVSDCSIFWRCVWGRLVRMHCPAGTLFNPSLSVCDWPSAVPHCPSSAGSSPPEAIVARPY